MLLFVFIIQNNILCCLKTNPNMKVLFDYNNMKKKKKNKSNSITYRCISKS